MKHIPVSTHAVAHGPTLEAARTNMLRQIAARLDAVALGASLAIVCGSTLLLATGFLALRDGPDAGLHLGLLSQYFPGYRVTVAGSLIGGLYAGAVGFLLGWLAASLRNALLRTYLQMVRSWIHLSDTYFLDRLE